MSEALEREIVSGERLMKAAIDHLRIELTKIRTGKASPAMLDGIMVSYYGTPTKLSQVANLSTPDSKTIAIQPWEKSMLGPIEQAIFAANLGLTPMNDGEFVRITIPPLTQDRRKQLVKQSKALGEDAKVSLRNARQKMMTSVKEAVKDGFPEDAGKKRESGIQSRVKNFASEVDDLIKAKEEDIMKI